MKKPILFTFLFFAFVQGGFAQFNPINLNFSYGALEPYIDSTTMYVHYNNHYFTYMNNLNNALRKYPDLQKKNLVDLFKNLNTLPSELKTPITNNGGGYYNHSLFWTMLAPPNTTPISKEMKDVIEKNFDSFESFQKQFEDLALSCFGSGWAWLMKKPNGELYIISTPNQNNPLMYSGLDPNSSKNDVIVLGLDVWDHAYYLKYRNKRADYIKAFWNVVNWTEVKKRYDGKQKDLFAQPD